MNEKQQMTLQAYRAQAMQIVADKTRTHEQTMMALAKLGENLLETPGVAPAYEQYKADGRICDLNEGHAPYTPRYILPDYDKFLRQGSAFLRLAPPTDLQGAVTALLILYRHVPSVTHFPVFIGRLDELLEPFVAKEQPKVARRILHDFLLTIDRTVTDSFCHGNIGPARTLTGEILLDCMRELQNSTPNLTLRYDPELTPRDFAERCAATALDCANPSFANHRMFLEEFGPDYGVASCYNGLPIGGGAFTLTRLILAKVAEHATSVEQFFDQTLPEAVQVMCGFMDAKIRFLVEQTPFFESNFLVREGLIARERFNGLFGMVGLCECVNRLMALQNSDERFGHGAQADAMGVRVMEALQALVNAHENPYCPYWNNHFMLHAQVGIETDYGVSPGARIAIGDELPLYEHLRQAALFHKYFPSGAGDIFPFDCTAAKNPAAVLDVLCGGLQVGCRYLSTYSSDSDVIRITGYLVKKSDMQALEAQNAVLHDTVALGLGAAQNAHILERKVRSL